MYYISQGWKVKNIGRLGWNKRKQLVSNYFRKFFNKEEQAAGEYVGFVSDNMKMQ